MPKAILKKVGKLAIIETEYGQKAVIPLESVCDLIIRFNIMITNDNIKCEKITSKGVSP